MEISKFNQKIIPIQTFMFLREQWSNVITLIHFPNFVASSTYSEGDCAEFEDKLYYLENDSGKAANLDFVGG